MPLAVGGPLHARDIHSAQPNDLVLGIADLGSDDFEGERRGCLDWGMKPRDRLSDERGGLNAKISDRRDRKTCVALHRRPPNEVENRTVARLNSQ